MKFIISESQYSRIFESQFEFGSEIEKDYLNKLCRASRDANSSSCQLLRLRPKLSDDLKNNLNKSVMVLHNFFGWRNKGILPKILDLSLQSPEKSVSFLDVITDFIVDPKFKKDPTKKQLKKISLMNEIPDNLEELLKDIRQKEYSQYENEFIGDYFEDNRTGLSLSYKCGDEVDLKFLEIIEKFRGLNRNQFKNLLKEIKKCISESLDENIAIKSDVKTKAPLYIVENGDKVEVFPSGSVFEIKKMDTGVDSYLSEFFSVFKQSSVKDLKPTHLNIYNAVIQGIYEWIKRKGKLYLEKIKSNMSGMIYDNYTIVPIEYIELYWSNLGQRGCDERRLSIRFRIKPEYRGKTIPGYKFIKNSDILEKRDIQVSSEDVTYRIC